MVAPFRLLIVDDQLRTRESIKALLSAGFSLSDVREARDGIEALNAVEQSLPDLIVMDARLAAMDGIVATRLVKSKYPQVKVIVLSMYSGYRAAALDAGADAFITKQEPLELLLATYRALAKSPSSNDWFAQSFKN